MSKKAETIKERFLKGYVTPEQLTKYYTLGVITKEEVELIYKAKYEPKRVEPVERPTAEPEVESEAADYGTPVYEE